MNQSLDNEYRAQGSQLKAHSSINRLLDIVVEEVSLVDRAANKRRFLVVKRSEEMSTNTESSEVSQQTEETEGQETSDTALETLETDDETTTLGAAVSALETLTEAVELLGSIENPDTHGRVLDLASELLSVAERLATPSVPAGVEDAAHSDTSRVPELNAALETMMDYIKGAIERVSVLVGSVTHPPQPPAGESAPNKDKQSDALIGELRSLTNMVKEQQQRLAKLEKRFGLPNSLPAGERRAKPGPKEDSWPLDLNNPMDRESVDKAVSFHEV